MQRKTSTPSVIAKKATQADIDAGIVIDSSAIVDVFWMDACAHMAVEKIDTAKLSELLCPTHTIGRVVAQDDEVICIATTLSAASGVDLIAIPVKWIEMITIFQPQE